MNIRMRMGFLAFAIALAGSASICPPRARAQVLPVAASVAESPPIPAPDIPAYITGAINSPDRPAADKALDAGRRPDQIMAFYGIKPGMKVADIFAGGGYMTELFARVVGRSGTVYSQNMPFPDKFKKIVDQWN